MKKARTTISIATYGSLPYTKQCLKALIKNTPEKLYNLVIFDNASKDKTVQWLTNDRNIVFPDERVKLIASPKNIGFAGAHNAVAKIVETEFLVFLNNDTIPLEGWLDSMVEVMDKYPECEVVGSKLISPLVNGLQHAGVVFSGIYPTHRLFGADPNCKEASKLQEFPAVTGACFMVRTKTFLENGGFDEKFWCGWEDIDYCLQMQKLRRKVIYQPKSVLYHYEGMSEGRMIAEDKNRTYFYQKWLPDIRTWVGNAYKELNKTGVKR